MDHTDKNILIYRRQYVLSPEKIDPPFLYQEILIGASYTLYAHIDLKVTSLQENDIALFLLGDLFDAKNPEKDNQQILEDLFDHDYISLLRKTEKLTGRYVIIYRNKEHLILFTDCISARKVFYTRNTPLPWYASQPHLLAKVTGIKITSDESVLAYYNSPVFKKLFNSNIGDLTCFDEIRQLRINHYFDATLNKPVRFWPYCKIERKSLKIAAEECASLIKGYCESLSNRYRKVMLPLTGGKDSRTLYGALRNTKADPYCYINNDGTADIDDFASPRIILEKDGRQFHIEATNQAVDSKFRELYFSNNPFASEQYLPLIYHYYEKFEDYVNLPGNIASAGFEFFKFVPKRISARQLAYMNYVTDFPFAEKYYENWLKEVTPLCSKYRMNVLSLFYWEERLGNWGTQIQIDKDIAQEDFNLLNSYRYVSQFFSVKPVYIMAPDYKMHKRILKILFPESMKIPFNRTTYRPIKSTLLKLGLLRLIYEARLKFKAR